MATTPKTPLTRQEVSLLASSWKKRLLLQLFPSISALLFCLFLLATILLGQNSLLNTDGDIYVHLRLGEIMLDKLAIVHNDYLTSTAAGAHFIPYEWGTEIIFAVLYRSAGFNAIVLFSGFLIACTTYGLFRIILARRVAFLLALPLTLLAMGLTSIHWLARPHLITLLFTMVFAEQVARYQRDGNVRRLVLLPFLFILWLNLHGGFLSALIILILALLSNLWESLLGSASARRRAWQLTVLAGVYLLATVLTPAGPGELAHIAGYLNDPLIGNSTQEFQSPNFHLLYGRLFLAVVLLAASIFIFRRQHPPLYDLFVVGGWSMLSFFSVRNIPLFALVATPIIAEQFHIWLEEPHETPWLQRLATTIQQRSARLVANNARFDGPFWPVVTLAAMLVLVLNGGYAGRTHLLNAHTSAARFPVQAINFARLHPQHGNVFNEFEWGGYIEFTLPEQPVFIDSRADFLGDRILTEYSEVQALGPHWQEVLDGEKVNWVLLHRHTPLSELLAHLQSWRLIYQDEVAVIYSRA